MKPENDSEQPEPAAEEESVVGVASTDLLAVFDYDRQAKLLSQAIDRIKVAEELLARNDVGNVDWWRERDEFLATSHHALTENEREN